MSAVNNNVQINQSANLFQSNNAVGLTRNQADDLKEIAKTFYGSGKKEGVNGGEGYVGAFKDSNGKVYLAKLMTHWSEYRGVKGKEAEYLKKLENSSNPKDRECAKQLRDSTERLCNRLIDIARAVGKEAEVAERLGMKHKAQEGGREGENSNESEYEYPPLLSRKIGIQAIKDILGSEEPVDLKMRSDQNLKFFKTKFDWDDIGKDRAATIKTTDAKSVVSVFANDPVKSKSAQGQKVGISNYTNETVKTDEEKAYFKFLDAMVGKTKLSEIDQGLVAKARKGQLARLKASVDTLQFDGPARRAWEDVTIRLSRLQEYINDRAQFIFDKNGTEKIAEKRKEFSTSGGLQFWEGKPLVSFGNIRAEDAFLHMFKQGLKKEIEAIEANKKNAPITPRELDDFMFKASHKAFVCGIVLSGIFQEAQTLDEKIRSDSRQAFKNDKELKSVMVYMDWEENSFDEIDKACYKEITKANLFGDTSRVDTNKSRMVNKSELDETLKAADIKRCRIIYTKALSCVSNMSDSVLGTFANTMNEGEYYTYLDTENAKDSHRDLLERAPNETDGLLGNVEDGDHGLPDPDENYSFNIKKDDWGKMIQELTNHVMRGTLQKTDSESNLFNQDVSIRTGADKAPTLVNFFDKLKSAYDINVFMGRK